MRHACPSRSPGAGSTVRHDSDSLGGGALPSWCPAVPAVHSRRPVRGQSWRGGLVRARASNEPLPAAAKWLLAVFGLLAANLLHSETYLEAGIAQAVFQISIAAPMFWVARMIRSEARLARLLWIILAASFLSAAVGVLQVYAPDWFLPPEFSSLAQRMNPEIVNALSYVGPGGRLIIRPPGLSDLPGGAALGGLIAVVIGVAFVGRKRYHPLARAFSAVAAAVGMTALYLTQVRSLTVMAG